MVFGGETAESYYDEGITASMKGEVELAIECFEKAVRLDNGHAGACHQLGKCYLRLGDPDKAAKLLEQVVAAQPKKIPPRVDLGYAYLDRCNYPQAQAIFAEVVALHPGNGRAQLGLAYCAFHQGSFDDAILLAKAAVNAGGANFPALLLLGHAATNVGQGDTAAEALTQADALMEKSIESSPDQPEGYYFRGEIHYVRGDYGKALDLYRAAEDRAKSGKHYSAYGRHFDRLDILAKRGLCLRHMGNQEGAKETGEQILRADPDHEIGQALVKGD